jgi:hypothetical protein
MGFDHLFFISVPKTNSCTFYIQLVINSNISLAEVTTKCAMTNARKFLVVNFLFCSNNALQTNRNQDKGCRGEKM